MLRDKTGIITSLACALCSLGALAQPPEAPETSDSVAVYFRVSRTELDPDFGPNREQFLPLARRLKAVLADPTFAITSVTVTGGASPEGSVEFNRMLSEGRAKAIFDYFSTLSHIPDSTMSFRYLGRDWQGLSRMVEADPATPYQQEVLDLIKRGQTSLLKTLHGGVPYKYMYTHHFPALRAARLKLTYNRPLPPLSEHQADTVVKTVVVRDTVYVQVDSLIYYCPPCKPFYMSARTNLVQDALLTPNLGQFNSAEAAMSFLETNDTDLIFLDINMPGLSGMDLARRLPDNAMVIFTTAYSEFAAESYEVNAVDYLIKPLEPERFNRTVLKALDFNRLLSGHQPENSIAPTKAGADWMFITAERRLLSPKAALHLNEHLPN